MQMRPAINLLRREHISIKYALGEFEEGIVTGQGGHGARDEEERRGKRKRKQARKKRKPEEAEREAEKIDLLHKLRTRPVGTTKRRSSRG
jgi:hypothetical protein